MKIQEIMTRDPKTCSLETTLEDVASLMRDEDVGAIPIVDDGELAGIITDRDIVVRCIADGKAPGDTTVEEVISEDLKTVSPDDDVQQAARIMADAQIRRLPVVDEDGNLVGMVSLGDIAVKHSDEEVSGGALEDISEGVKRGSGGGRRQSQQAQTGRRASKGSESERIGSRRASVQPVPLSRNPEQRRGTQGIANRNVSEEGRRQERVTPSRASSRSRRRAG